MRNSGGLTGYVAFRQHLEFIGLYPHSPLSVVLTVIPDDPSPLNTSTQLHDNPALKLVSKFEFGGSKNITSRYGNATN
jgi:hypothetical protein